MIIAYDVETQSLNANNFIAGDIYTERKVHYTFTDKKKLWEKILELGEKEKKRNKQLIVYAHNGIYDFLSVGDLSHPELRIYVQNPFFAQLDNIKFCDSMALFRGSLAQLGATLQFEKGETPTWLFEDTYEPTEKEFEEMITYLKRDTEIIIEAILTLKKVLKKEHMQPRILFSIGQLGINYTLKQLKKNKQSAALFKQGTNEKGIPYKALGTLFPCINKEKIHSAYRAGRVQAFKTGTFPVTSQVDKNSMYSYASTLIDFPDLSTETLIEEPTKKGYSSSILLSKIGVSEVLIETPENLPIGFLPIRTGDHTVYPTGKKILIGTWTHEELRYALTLGYTLHHIRWSVIWDTLPENPLGPIMEELYQKRLRSETPFENAFYKGVMNYTIGKFGQRRPRKEKRMAPVDDAPSLAQDGWQPVHAIGNHYLYEKTTGIYYPHYYAPIICASINAKGRILLYEKIKQMSPKDILYTDTDSILFLHKKQYIDTFIYGSHISEWKIEHSKERALIYGMKTYMVGDVIKMSGVGKDWINAADFVKGVVTYKRLITFQGAHTEQMIGTSETITHDLTALPYDDDEDTEEQQLFIDSENAEHENIIYYLPYLEDIL